MERGEGLHVLSTRGWLTSVPKDFRNELLSEARWRRFGRGEQISLAGDEGGDLIGLAEGYVAFQVSFGQPGSPILHMTPPVFWFGYRNIVADDGRIASGLAMSTVACATITRRHVRALLESHPEWWKHLMPLAMEYGDTAATIASDLLIPDAKARLVAVLLRFAGLRRPVPDASAPVCVPVTQQDLAAAANLSRNWTGSILRRLAADGSVETGYNGVTLLDPPRLRTILETHV